MNYFKAGIVILLTAVALSFSPAIGAAELHGATNYTQVREAMGPHLKSIDEATLCGSVTAKRLIFGDLDWRSPDRVDVWLEYGDDKRVTTVINYSDLTMKERKQAKKPLQGLLKRISNDCSYPYYPYYPFRSTVTCTTNTYGNTVTTTCRSY